MMKKFVCSVCGYIHNGDGPPELCPVCGASKEKFKESIENEISQELDANNYLAEWKRGSDALEVHMSDIHKIASTGKSSLIEPMRTQKKVIAWDDILVKGAQLSAIPLNKNEPVNARTIIGPNAKAPLIIETPIYITHMSFGALSREVKIALAKGSSLAKTAMASGEGGILKESFENAYKYIFEYVPNKYSVTEENLKKVDAIEIKIGQSAKPGMGATLAGSKVTKEIAEIRGFSEGEEIVSPAHFDDIKNKDDLLKKVDWLREQSKGKPVGIKMAAGNIEDDLKIAVYAKPDFITIDGRPGCTGSAIKFIKDATSIPTIFALYRAKKFLDKHGKDISLVITGGLRISSDFIKALAMGADAIAIGTSALMACGCQQYRLCDTGLCPTGITTHDSELRKRFNVDLSAKRLSNFLKITTEELKDFARLTGNSDLHGLNIKDLCTTNSEISGNTNIEHV